MFYLGKLMKTLFVLLVSLLISGCEQPQPSPPPPRPALVMTVGSRTHASPTILIGEVRSRYESAQGFRIAGKIIKRYVDAGARVTKNQLLARLDNQDTGFSANAAQAQVQSAKADMALAAAELARHRQLFERNFISKQALDIQEAKYKSAAALVKQSQAQAAVSNNQSRYTDLLAEQDGAITEIRAEPGQVVAAGEVITRIAALDALEIAIDVPESRMRGIAIDTPAEIRLWADPSRQYQGKVRELAAAADSITRTFQMRVALPATDEQVRLGMTAGVRFYALDSDELIIPLPAVTQLDGKTVVWVMDPQTKQVQPRPVETGMFREDGVIITQGLQSGEQIVAAGVQTLAPGQIVRPLPMQSSQ